jgi:hypothetical protein
LVIYALKSGYSKEGRMIKARLAAVLMIALLTGCASHKASQYIINGEEVFLGWNNQKNLPSNAFYVLLEGDKEGVNWTIKEIYDHPIKGRSNELQEVLFVDKEFRYIQPYYEYAASTVVSYGEETQGTLVGRTNSNGQIMVTGMDVKTKKQYMDRGSWECGYIMKDHKNQYTPCSSRLTKTDVARSIGKNIFATALTLGLASGTHQVVDKDKMAEIIKQTDLFEQIKKSNLYSQANKQ